MPLNWMSGDYTRYPIINAIPAPPTVTVPAAVMQTTVMPGMVPAGPPFYAPLVAPAPVVSVNTLIDDYLPRLLIRPLPLHRQAPIYAGYAPYAYGVPPPPYGPTYSPPLGYPAMGNYGGYIPGWTGHY